MPKRKISKMAIFGTAALAIVAAVVPFVIWCLRGGPEQELVPSYSGPQSTWQDIRGPLIQTLWRQDGPYAALAPGTDLLGCWSIAFAQVLAYHHLQPAGRVSYQTSGGVAIDRILSSQVNWNQIVPAIDSATTPEKSLQTAQYCYDAAVVVQKDFGRGEYMNIERVPDEIAEHFSCRIKRIEPGRAETVTSELRASRPLVAYFDDILGVNDSLGFKIVRIGHAAVLDGMAEENGRLIVHVNFGWGGASDGWYDFKKLTKERELLYLFQVVPPERVSGLRFSVF